MTKVVVIGLDGLAWHILDRLFSWGIMPNLQKLAEKSLKGTLPSTIPPESAPAWTSISTGVNPGKHGIFGFTKPTEDCSDTRIMSSRDVKYLRIHEMVAVQNLRSICINQLLTYPMRTIEGSFIITDWLSPRLDFSPEIAQYAKNYCAPTLGKLSPFLRNDWKAEYAELSSRVDTVNTLLQKFDWDLFWVVYSEPDRLFHRCYDLVMRKDEQIMRLFAKIDETFGLVENLADLLIVVSDHGFAKFKHGVYVNKFLKEMRLAKAADRVTLKDLVRKRQDAQVSRVRALRKFHVPQGLLKFLSFTPSPVELILVRIYKQMLKADIRGSVATHVDPKSSKAFSHGFGIYVKEKELIDRIVGMLKKERSLGGVWKREELYEGRQVKDMPDIIMVPNFDEGFALRGDAITHKPVVRRHFPSHHPDGIVMICKKGLQPTRLNRISVYDIAPTILKFLDLDIPADTDGKAMKLRSA